MEKQRTVTLHTGCGPVRGISREGLWLFRGIPYAESPRFQKPSLIRSWEGELDATGIETDCWQYSAFRDEEVGGGTFYYREFRSGRKDYQYAESPQELSIVAPTDAKNAPVLLFFHGGGHETGTVGELPYGPCTEYARRGIVYVSAGFRLNVFSLYNCGNYGLHDQITAVRWVHEYIAAFGGDPEKITVMGQSAGAMSVTDLCYTQVLKGLIRGAVMISGGGCVPKIASPATKRQAEPFWQAVRDRAGARSEEDMRTLPPEVIWEAWYAVSRERGNYTVMQPGIDGEIIPDIPQKLLERGEDLDVPMLFGVTSQDFMPMVIFEIALGWALRSSRLGRKPVYGYFFDRTPPGNYYKAFHAADLWYLFGNMDKSWRPFEKRDYELSRQMADCIAAFVKTGSPNGKGLPYWPAVSHKQKGFRLFNGESHGLIYPMACRRKLLKTFLWDKGPM